MPTNKFYLGKYFFALYDRNDHFYNFADNVNELMNLFNIPINRKTTNQMQGRLYHALKRDNSRIYINGLKLSIYLIPVDEEETLCKSETKLN